jgi:hypothetical protein
VDQLEPAVVQAVVQAVSSLHKTAVKDLVEVELEY